MKEISMVVQANKISYYGISDIYITKTSKLHIVATHIKNVCNVNVRDNHGRNLYGGSGQQDFLPWYL